LVKLICSPKQNQTNQFKTKTAHYSIHKYTSPPSEIDRCSSFGHPVTESPLHTPGARSLYHCRQISNK